jgi:tetratricopeptide (TPR) repeat protein
MLRHGAVLAVLLSLAVGGAMADESELTHSQKGDAFLAYLEENGVEGEALETLKARWAEMKGSGDTGDFITEGLIHTDRSFRSGLRKYEQDYPEQAIEKFSDIVANSENPYAKATAAYYQARCHILEDEYADAEPLLAKVHGEWLGYTQLDAEASFFLGMCRAQLLQRDDAIRALETFLEKYPEASERFREAAITLRDELKVRGENELLDLADRMTIVERMLDKTQTGEPTEQRIGEIVEILEELIKKHEQECGT